MYDAVFAMAVIILTILSVGYVIFCDAPPNVERKPLGRSGARATPHRIAVTVTNNTDVDMRINIKTGLGEQIPFGTIPYKKNPWKEWPEYWRVTKTFDIINNYFLIQGTRKLTLPYGWDETNSFRIELPANPPSQIDIIMTAPYMEGPEVQAAKGASAVYKQSNPLYNAHPPSK